MPSFNPWAGNFTISGNGGGCPSPNVTTTVSTSDGQDHIFSYLAVPTLAASSLALQADRSAAQVFPRRRSAAYGRKAH